VFASVDRSLASDVPGHRFHAVPDANRDERLRAIWCLIVVIWIMLRERPHVVVTTGAAPGCLALRIARLMRRRTIWIDSIANADRVSLGGTMARSSADLWLTQWQHLAHSDGPAYFGAVL
jgi:hypothetical protein